MMKRKLSFMLASVILPPIALAVEKEEKPNILWLTFEDTSAYTFGCYGNKSTTTPIVDSLAKQGIQFMNAYSSGPQSSAARSTLITGCYATTYAMDYHRCKVATPEKIFYPDFLRDAGYYCTNNIKTDYNSSRDKESCWDECSKEATYNSPKRKPNQPFFAVFNSHVSHMSRFTSIHLDGRRDFVEEGLAPASLELPSHVPDTEAMRSDYAFHLEGVNDVDRWVNFFLEDLKAKGLDDNTIIFVFSDHGGCLPRGKGYQYESSYRVPFVVYLPPKWEHLSKMKIGEPTDRLVCFADFAPTVFSMIGVDIPKHMQGIPFLGKADKIEREYQFGLATNQAKHFLASRTVSDGKMKYIRRFIPYKNNALLNEFQWQMPSNLYWDKLYFEGKAKSDVAKATFEINDAELLFDLENDPFETNNLANDANYQTELSQLRGVLSNHMRSTKDLGLFIYELRDLETPMHTTIRETNYDLEGLYEVAEMTANVSVNNIPELRRILKEGDDAKSYWAVVNFAVLARRGDLKRAPSELVAMLSSSIIEIAQESAYALYFTNKRDKALEFLAKDVKESSRVLEMLTFEDNMWTEIPESIRTELRELAQMECAPKQDHVVRARKILVNVGEIPAELLYSDDRYEDGLRINQNRRPLLPLP